MKAVANLMVAAATTAPKSKGFDDLTVKIITGKEIQQIANEIRQMWRDEYTSGTFWFLGPDAEAVETSTTLVLLGVHAKRPPLQLNCGACGYETCSEFEEAIGQKKTTALCAYKILDLGIALSSAARVASENFIDNRVMWSVGVAAKRLGLIEGDFAFGIPLAASGSNPFFDRYLRYFIQKAREENKPLNQILREHGIEI